MTTPNNVEKEIEQLVDWLGKEGVDMNEMDPKEAEALRTAREQAKSSVKWASAWLVGLTILTGLFGCVLLGLGIALDSHVAGYYGFVWCLPLIIDVLGVGAVAIIIWTNPKERDGLVKQALIVACMCAGAVWLAMAAHNVRTIMDVANCANANWTVPGSPGTPGIFADHLAICDWKGTVVTQMIFNLLIAITVTAQPFFLYWLSSSTHHIAVLIWKLKLGGIIGRYNEITNRVKSTVDDALSGLSRRTDTKAFIGSKLHRNVTRAMIAGHHGVMAMKTSDILAHVGHVTTPPFQSAPIVGAYGA
jgi:hypothetical protein